MGVQGKARRGANGRSIATSCNATLLHQSRAIRPVAACHQMGERKIYDHLIKIMMSHPRRSGQLPFLGLTEIIH